MPRLRTSSPLRCLVAAAGLVLVTTMLTAPGHAQDTTVDTPERVGAGVAKPVRPKIGQCRQLTRSQFRSSSDASKPVSCSKRHNLRVIRVADLPAGMDFRGDAAADFAADKCFAAVRTAAVGGSDLALAKTAFDYVYFFPTKAEQQAGARYVRCDIALHDGADFQSLPTTRPPFVTGDVPERFRRCNNNRPPFTTCDRSHTFRADFAFRVGGRKFPGDAALQDMARRRCTAQDGPRIYAYYPQRRAWDGGNQVIVCLAPD